MHYLKKNAKDDMRIRGCGRVDFYYKHQRGYRNSVGRILMGWMTQRRKIGTIGVILASITVIVVGLIVLLLNELWSFIERTIMCIFLVSVGIFFIITQIGEIRILLADIKMKNRWRRV